MNQEMVGKKCFLQNYNGNEYVEGRVIKVFSEVGGECHGNTFVCVILEDSRLSMWENEVVVPIHQVEMKK